MFWKDGRSDSDGLLQQTTTMFELERGRRGRFGREEDRVFLDGSDTWRDG